MKANTNDNKIQTEFESFFITVFDNKTSRKHLISSYRQAIVLLIALKR